MATTTTKDLSRAVAFLTLERVQQTADEAKTAFLAGKGFTADEITEAKRQAEEVLRQKRSSSASAGSTHQTFGGGGAPAAAAAAGSTIRHVLDEPGTKASTRGTLGGGGLSFVSLASGPSDGIRPYGVDALVKDLLARLDTTLAAGAPARGKADVAVLYLTVKGLGKYEEEIHQVLDGWVDPQAPPVRFLVEEAGARNGAQLMAVVRG